jgi:hypothetical protein
MDDDLTLGCVGDDGAGLFTQRVDARGRIIREHLDDDAL